MLKFCESRIKVFRGDDIQLPSSCEGVFRDISLVDCGGGTLAATWTSETEKFHFDYDAPADELSQSYRKRREVVIEHKLCLIDVSAGLVKWTVALEGAVEELVYGDGVLLLNYFCNTGVSLGVVRIKRRSLCAIGVRALRRYKVYAISGQVSEFVCAYRPQFVIGRGGRGGDGGGGGGGIAGGRRIGRTVYHFFFPLTHCTWRESTQFFLFLSLSSFSPFFREGVKRTLFFFRWWKLRSVGWVVF